MLTFMIVTFKILKVQWSMENSLTLITSQTAP